MQHPRKFHPADECLVVYVKMPFGTTLANKSQTGGQTCLFMDISNSILILLRLGVEAPLDTRHPCHEQLHHLPNT